MPRHTTALIEGSLRWTNTIIAPRGTTPTPTVAAWLQRPRLRAMPTPAGATPRAEAPATPPLIVGPHNCVGRPTGASADPRAQTRPGTCAMTHRSTGGGRSGSRGWPPPPTAPPGAGGLPCKAQADEARGGAKPPVGPGPARRKGAGRGAGTHPPEGPPRDRYTNDPRPRGPPPIEAGVKSYAGGATQTTPSLTWRTAEGNPAADAPMAWHGPCMEAHTSHQIYRLPTGWTHQHLTDHFMCLDGAVGMAEAYSGGEMHWYLTFQVHHQAVAACAVVSAALGTITARPGQQPAVVNCVPHATVHPATVYGRHGAPLGAAGGRGGVGPAPVGWASCPHGGGRPAPHGPMAS